MTNHTPTNYIGLCRTSTDRQDYSIESQQEILKSFTEKNGDHLVKVYVEKVSGKHNQKNRPKLMAAIKHAKSIGGKLLIHKLDRLSRSLYTVVSLMEQRVPFVAVDNPHANELTIHILVAVAEAERKAISKRIKDALVVVKRKRGKLGSPSINTLAQENRNRAIDFAQKHYPMLRELRDKGYSYKKITETMNRKRIPSVNGSGWSGKTVWNILNKYQQEVCQ